MSISYKTPVHFSTFSCLGGDCEDTCCRNWEVKLDKTHYELLETAMAVDEHDESMFRQYIRLNDSMISGDHDYAFIRMSVNGYCAMLDEKGLCSIHAKFGTTPMGNVCTMFPRVVSRCMDTVELSGALSCPEVVRSCIDDSTPLKLKRFKPADLPRSKNYPIHREVIADKDDFYSENFQLVRSAMMQVMANEETSLDTRLYATANMAHKISSFYHSGCHKDNKNNLSSILSALSEDDFITKLSVVIHDFESGSSISMIVVHSILSIKLQQSADENISLLYANIISQLSNSGSDKNIPNLLTAKLTEINEKISKVNLLYIDKALTRYVLNCLYREWFISMPDPFTYFQMLLVRVSILRSLIYLDLLSSEEVDLHKVKERIVYIMYNFARNIDQNLEFLKVVYNALSEQEMMNFDFSATFIRIY